MRTLLRYAGFSIAAAVTVVVLALPVVPGLASASSGAPEDTQAGTIEPSPAVDLPLLDATPQPASTKPAPPAPRSDPNGSVSSPVLPFDPGYWTPERMANAKPMPMPTVP